MDYYFLTAFSSFITTYVFIWAYIIGIIFLSHSKYSIGSYLGVGALIGVISPLLMSIDNPLYMVFTGVIQGLCIGAISYFIMGERKSIKQTTTD